MRTAVIIVQAAGIIVSLRAGNAVVFALYKYIVACLHGTPDDGLKEGSCSSYYISIYGVSRCITRSVVCFVRRSHWTTHQSVPGITVKVKL